MTSDLERIEKVTGRAVVVRGDDIDTDAIIPGRFLKTVTFEDLESHVFADLRRDPEGRPKGHPFDSPRFAGASILVVNRNFGCGSSREHAPQALRRWGIRAIVGESFAEIFFGTCVALGVPAVTASRDDVYRLMDAVELDPEQEIAVDLPSGSLRFRGGSIPIDIPDWARGQLCEGSWDATRTLLMVRDSIWRTADRLPYISGF
jgi:3-isopropylmalate/(R)-2-methylmalate dehydratase small subunit